MKLGIKREKFGDIVIYDQGADVVVLNEVSKILLDGIKELIRFRKSNIELLFKGRTVLCGEKGYMQT